MNKEERIKLMKRMVRDMTKAKAPVKKEVKKVATKKVAAKKPIAKKK